MQIGIDSFVVTRRDPTTGITIGASERLKNLFEEIKRADEVGIDVFGVGEHHRSDSSKLIPSLG